MAWRQDHGLVPTTASGIRGKRTSSQLVFVREPLTWHSPTRLIPGGEVPRPAAVVRGECCVVQR